MQKPGTGLWRGDEVARLCGVAAPLVYLAAVICGGASTPGYDHLAAPISALTAGGSGPWWVYALFLAYNLLLLAFGLSLPIRTTRLALVASAVTGIGMLVFAMDPAGGAMSPAGLIHLVLAGVASLSSMSAIGGAALWFKRHGEVRAAIVMALALAIVFVAGATTAAATANGSSIAGLLERVTIGTFLLALGGLAAMRRPLRP